MILRHFLKQSRFIHVLQQSRFISLTSKRSPFSTIGTAASTPYLSHETITKASTNDPTNEYTGAIVFLHGILGSGQNLRSFARRIANAYPGTKCVLIDLRAHGDSPSMDVPGTTATVDACAEDVARLVAHLGIAPDLLWGHSFGGKVVLSLLSNETLQQHVNDVARSTGGGTSGDAGEYASSDASDHGVCKAAWVIDSQPGLVELKGFDSNPNKQSVEGIIGTLAQVPPPFDSKEDVMTQLGKHGIERSIQKWMTTNVIRNEEDQFVWKFDISVVKELFVDYCNKDMWPVMGGVGNGGGGGGGGGDGADGKGGGETTALPVELHLVRALKNPFWDRPSTPVLLQSALDQNPHMRVHDVDAGHWLHAEKPRELFDIMVDEDLEQLLR